MRTIAKLALAVATFGLSGCYGIDVYEPYPPAPREPVVIVEHTPVDHDRDGVSDDDEALLYLDPWRADTDGDGLEDGDELYAFYTDPADRDSDGDRLEDGTEIFDTFTDPLDYDTDRDGIEDGDEVTDWYSDPLDPYDPFY